MAEEIPYGSSGSVSSADVAARKAKLDAIPSWAEMSAWDKAAYLDNVAKGKVTALREYFIMKPGGKSGTVMSPGDFGYGGSYTPLNATYEYLRFLDPSGQRWEDTLKGIPGLNLDSSFIETRRKEDGSYQPYSLADIKNFLGETAGDWKSIVGGGSDTAQQKNISRFRGAISQQATKLFNQQKELLQKYPDPNDPRRVLDLRLKDFQNIQQVAPTYDATRHDARQGLTEGLIKGTGLAILGAGVGQALSGTGVAGGGGGAAGSTGGVTPLSASELAKINSLYRAGEGSLIASTAGGASSLGTVGGALAGGGAGAGGIDTIVSSTNQAPNLDLSKIGMPGSAVPFIGPPVNPPPPVDPNIPGIEVTTDPYVPGGPPPVIPLTTPGVVDLIEPGTIQAKDPSLPKDAYEGTSIGDKLLKKFSDEAIGSLLADPVAPTIGRPGTSPATAQIAGLPYDPAALTPGAAIARNALLPQQRLSNIGKYLTDSQLSGGLY